MPNGRRTRTAANKRLSPARKKAIDKINKIISKQEKNRSSFGHQEASARMYDPREAAEFRELITESTNKIEKGKKLIDKIKAGQKKPLTRRSTIKELTPRARPWVEYIIKDRNTVSQLLNHAEKQSFEKMASGKRVTRDDMNNIINGIREFRSVFPQRMPPSLRPKRK